MGSALLPIASRALTTQPARFHLSLNTGDLDRMVEFLKALIGAEPAKCRSDYAKFELDDPPLVLSLEPSSAAPAPQGGALNHLGFRVSSGEALVQVQRRLELSGIETRREEGVECCYARQTKFWVHDPDGNLWEIYTLDEDLEHRGDGHAPHHHETPSHPSTQASVSNPAPTGAVARPEPASASAPPPGPAESRWSHRLGQPFPAKLPILDATVDYISLEGSFNEVLTPEQFQSRLSELRRILKPGGRLHLHLLTSDRPIPFGTPIQLPGPAAPVKAVPACDELLAALAAAGFGSPRLAFLAKSACFGVGEAHLHETRIEADG